MKRQGILHAELASVTASMGHGDTIAVVDAGMPIPISAHKIDLAVIENLPNFEPVVSAIFEELHVERYVIAEELQSGNTKLTNSLATILDNVPAVIAPHSQMRADLALCRAVVRTGEFTPYANVILQSGLAFS